METKNTPFVDESNHMLTREQIHAIDQLVPIRLDYKNPKPVGSQIKLILDIPIRRNWTDGKPYRPNTIIRNDSFDYDHKREDAVNWIFQKTGLMPVSFIQSKSDSHNQGFTSHTLLYKWLDDEFTNTVDTFDKLFEV